MPPPPNSLVPDESSLTPAHLRSVMVPSFAAPLPHLDLALVRTDTLVELAESWRDRFVLLPPREEQPTLQDLIQNARRRLRSDRLNVDAIELTTRKFVLNEVRRELLT